MKLLPFLEDIYPDNLLYGLTLRSPVPRGQLKLIQVPMFPKDYTLVTAKDIPGENLLPDSKIPILADGQLSYAGEPVAILFGPDKTKLEELASKCFVKVQEEPPAFNFKDIEEPEVKRNITIGETDEIFEKAGKIVTGSYTTGIQDHWYAEPVGAITFFKDDSALKKAKKTEPSVSGLVVRTSTQWPYHVKRAIVRVLGMDPASVFIEPTALNLHMDGKLWYPSLVACHAALGTLITKRPVRLILNREEDFLYTPKRCAVNIDIASAIDDNGNLLGSNIDIFVNLGSYGVNSEEILDQVCLGALGFYKNTNLKLTASANCTNIPPQGPFTGFGIAQGLFAAERHVSQIAEAVNKDPAQWRLAHADSQQILPPASANRVKRPGSADDICKELIDTAAKMSDYYRKWASHDLLRQGRKGHLPEKGDNPRGIGIALGYQGGSLLYHGEDKGVFSVEVTLTKESHLEIRTSLTTSEDYNKIWEKVALETMSIKPEMIHIISANALDCGPSCSSRNITAVTKLVEKCCLAIRKERSHQPLPITVRRSSKPQNGHLWGGLFTPPENKVMDVSGFVKPGFAAAVVEVSIDFVECIPVVRGVWLAVDGGKIISKNRAIRNISRGASQALGWAFTENVEYINGVLPESQYENFSIFSPVETPPIHIEFLASDNSEPKGIGDLPSACIPAAFMQAVSQAMGYSFKSIPIKRKDIWEMIRVRK